MKKAKKAAKKSQAKKAAPKKAATKTIKKAMVLEVPARTPAAENKSGVTPLADRVVIEPTVPESITSFGLIIPETSSKEKAETGVVIAVGPGRTADDGSHIPVGVTIGDRVMFNKYGFDEVKVNGKEYYIISETNILAILE